MAEQVNVARNGGILEITLDNPKANAIDLKISQQLGEAFVTLRDDPELSVAIITGGGEKIFCAGWDLKSLNSGEMQMNNWWKKYSAQCRKIRRYRSILRMATSVA